MDISPPTTISTTPTPTPHLIIRPPPPFPAEPRSVDLSALEFVLAIVAVISIPALIYTFFFAFKCPPDPLRRGRHHRQRHDQTPASDSSLEIPDAGEAAAAATSEVKYSKEAHAQELGGECPICLLEFAEGEEVKKLSACEHAFHVACIDPWLSSHANCPVCRASVAVNGNNNKPPTPSGGDSGSSGNNVNNRGSSRNRRDDFHQGLPDAADLV